MAAAFLGSGGDTDGDGSQQGWSSVAPRSRGGGARGPRTHAATVLAAAELATPARTQAAELAAAAAP